MTQSRPRFHGLTPVAALLVLACAASGGDAQAAHADPAARHADVEAFRLRFLDVDRSYSAAHRAEAVRRLAQLDSEAARLSAAAFELELARIVALADNGHTNAAATLRARRYSRVRIRFVPLGTSFFVLRADTVNADLLGAHVVAIDGHPIGEVRDSAHTLFGGTPTFRDRQVPLFIESPEQMQVLGMASSATAATYRFVLLDGRTLERRLEADPPGTSEPFGPSRWLYPAVPDDHRTWRSLGVPERMPWAFQEPMRIFRMRAAPEIDGMVIQLRANRTTAGEAIDEFLRHATDEIRRARPTNLVLDMRLNGGGDLNTTRDFAESLPSLVPGRIVVLTSPWTFSAAISTTGYLKQAGGERVTIVGEMVGDRLEFWAEGRPMTLPNSGFTASVATERHDYRTGCKPFPDCHGSVVRHPISVASLAPDIEAPMTIEAYVAGRDPGMEAVARALGKR